MLLPLFKKARLFLWIFMWFVISKSTAQLHKDSINYFINLQVPDSIKVQKLVTYSRNFDFKEEIKIKILKTSLNLARKGKLYKNEFSVMEELGYVYQMRGMSNLAYDNYNQGMLLATAHKDSLLWLKACYKLGYLFSSLDDYEKGNQYFQMIIENSRSLKAQASAELAIGTNYVTIDSLDLAFRFLNKARIYFESQAKQMARLAFIYDAIGQIYLKKLNYLKSEEYFLKSIDSATEINDLHAATMGRLNLARIANIKGDYNKALNYLNGINEIILKSYDLYRKRDYEYELYLTNKGLGKYQDALTALGNAYDFKSELYKSENNNSMNNLEQKYQNKNRLLEIQNQKLKLIKNEAEKNYIKQQKERQMIVFFAVIFILLINGFLIYKRYLKSQKDRAIILEKNTIIQAKQKEILDSIHYAKRIQTTLLTNESYIQKSLSKLNKFNVKTD